MRSITDQIREALTKRDGISEQAMRPLAEAYAAEVTRVNGRLSAAGALLHKGLRSEAIQNASIAPNAIDDAAKLDFAEFDDWCEILQFLAISVPPMLLRDLADQLNESIVESQPIEELLKRQRRLAIARAPLEWRLKVLRKIAEIDSFNAHWLDDIEQWEKARHKQIAAAAATVIAAGDLGASRGLHHELTQTRWRVAPERSTLVGLQTTIEKLTERDTLSQLESTAAELHESFCQFDEPAARQSLARWNRLTANFKGTVPAALAEQAEGAVDWIAVLDREKTEREARARAIGHLDAALDRGAPLHELERAYHQTTTFDPPPPEELLQRYQVAVEERRLTKRRLFQATLGGIAAVTVIAIGLLGWWQYRSAQQSWIAAAETEFQSLLDVGNLEGASTFYDDLKINDPGTAMAPAVAGLFGQLQLLVKEERQRATQFAEYLKAADTEDASQIDLAALGRADALAGTEPERAAVFQIRRRRQQWESETAAHESSELLKQLAVHRDRLAEIEAGEANGQAMSAVATVIAALTTLHNSYPRADASARDQASSARTRAMTMRSAIHSRMERARSEREALSDVLNASSLDQLARSLQRFATAAPQSALVREFSQAATEKPLWSTAAAWNAYADAAAAAIAGRMVSADVKAFRLVQSDLKAKVTIPFGRLPATAIERLERYDEREEILERVLGGLPDTVIADLYTVVESAGQGDRYFMYKSYRESNATRFEAFSPDFDIKTRGLEVVVNDSGAVENKGLQGEYQVIHEPYDTIQWVLNEYRAKRQDFLTDWEGSFLRLAAELCKRSGLDSQIKEMLLQHVLAGALEGSGRLAKGLTEELVWLKNHASTRATWYLPVPFDDALAREAKPWVCPHLWAILGCLCESFASEREGIRGGYL